MSVTGYVWFDFGSQEHGSPDLNMNGAIQVSAIQRCLFTLKTKLTKPRHF